MDEAALTGETYPVEKLPGVLAAAILALAYTPLAGPPGFAALPTMFRPALGAIVGLYALAAKRTKKAFFRQVAS